LQTGGGMIHASKAENVVIRNNIFFDLQFGSGIRGNGNNNVVERNQLQRIGTTGISFSSGTNNIVRSNILSEFLGNHGNAMAFYGSNINLLVKDNCVFSSIRPLTWHGDRTGSTVNNINIVDNIFMSTGDHASASWGKSTIGVTYRNNLAIGAKYGVLLNASDTNVTVTQNRMRKIVFNGGQPAAWTVSDNQEDATYAEVADATLTMNGCRARGHSGDLVVSL